MGYCMNAMYDYIGITKQLHKDNINLSNLEHIASSRNCEHYLIPGIKPMKLQYNKDNKLMRITGSVPYWVNGHNFSITMAEYNTGLDYMADLLKVKISDAIVDVMEFGAIVNTSLPANQIISAHSSAKGMKSVIYDNGRYFSDSACKVKMYNAKARIFQNLDKGTQHEIEAAGFDRKADWVKVEAHYLKPHMAINKGAGIILSDLFRPDFIRKTEENFLYQYSRLSFIKSVEIPMNKKHLKTDNLLMLALAEVSGNIGKSPKDLAYGILNQIPDEVLSPNDKKARRAQIRKLLKQISTDITSKYDLSPLLQDAMLYHRTA
ncbi:MAG: hypothetical protein A2W93_06270 [Bacteroidetes bacterium GWF2_43_63]|nr:MAG: hypothetical protein A2W93_06270 [Bacteroidetes bacterium GWF2_43_63]HBG71783.1 hypothetical protein [Bacteroidales bacterium]